MIANRHNGEKKCPKKCIFSNFPIHASYAPAHPSSHLHWYMERLPTARSTTADHPQQYCKASAVRLQPICTMTVIHRAPSIRQSRFLKKFPQRSHFFLFHAQFAITSITSAITCPKESNRQITNHLHYLRDSSDSKTDQNFFSYAASGFVYHHGTQFLDLPNHCLHSPTPCLMVKIQRPNNEKRKNDS